MLKGHMEQIPSRMVSGILKLGSVDHSLPCFGWIPLARRAQTFLQTSGWYASFICSRWPHLDHLVSESALGSRRYMMAIKKPTIDQLRELVQQASRENPHLTSRLEKAAFLVLLRPLVS